jgi:prepilin-type N-terminal cleavage/methylation domain-containing protein
MLKTQRAMRHEEGFTLIELLIVIVILGILATVVVFAVSGITDRGKKSSCAADKATVETAIEAYDANYNAYPTSAALLVSGGLLRAESTKYTVAITTSGSATFTAVPGGGCE